MLFETPPAGQRTLAFELREPRAWLRTSLVALSAIALAVTFEAPAAVTWIVTACALLAVLIERNSLRAEASQRLGVAVAAARAEGQRDAMAQLMSLQLAHDRAHSVFESLGEGVIVVDDGGEIVLANPAARRAMQAPTVDPVGRVLWEALAPQVGRRAQEAWDRLRRQQSDDREPGVIRDTEILSHDRVYDLTAVDATSQQTGQSFGSVFLLVDSTHVYELQRLKDRFLSSVSHELRTPLTNICAYAEILDGFSPSAAGEPVENKDWPEFVKVIHDEGRRLSRLVDCMFDYLQLESGQAVFRQERIDGAEVVRRVVAEFEASIAPGRVQLCSSLPPAAMPLLVDAQRLEQVVRNLIDNALKFTPAGGVVRVALEWRDEAFALTVEDSGPGVPESEREALFDKFHQLRDHMTDKPTGTGIGLAASRVIIARFRGRIWCGQSSLGGAAFTVLLPAFGNAKVSPAGISGGDVGS